VPVRAFLFDFDGLILDTEVPSRAGWELLYREHGHELPAEKWRLVVGTRGVWDPMAHLEELVGAPLAREALHERRRAHELSLIEAEELRPGIEEYLDAADRLGLRLAIVSSSSRRWIDLHLRRLERAHRFELILAAGHDPARAKPAPTLYLEALERFGLAAGEAVAFEDSPNGVAAAKAAGIFTVAVPNEVTRDYALGEADLVLDSLADLPPDELLARMP
jgi:HAD superfamily hydrolase (TIGR01509 family)